MTLRARIIFSIPLIAMTSAAIAQDRSGASSTIRSAKPFGVYVGVAAEPYPSIFSANLAYNATDNLRVSAGAGTVVFGSSYGAGIKYLFSPENPFSPIAGVNVVRTTISDFLSGAFGLKPSPDDVVWSSTLSGGIDWQTQSGFNLGAGVNWMYLSNPSETIGTKVFPYLTVGWFFRVGENRKT